MITTDRHRITILKVMGWGECCVAEVIEEVFALFGFTPSASRVEQATDSLSALRQVVVNLNRLVGFRHVHCNSPAFKQIKRLLAGLQPA